MITVDMSFEHMMAQIQYFFRIQFYGSRGAAGITATVGTISIGITAIIGTAPTVREGNS